MCQRFATVQIGGTAPPIDVKEGNEQLWSFSISEMLLKQQTIRSHYGIIVSVWFWTTRTKTSSYNGNKSKYVIQAILLVVIHDKQYIGPAPHPQINYHGTMGLITPLYLVKGVVFSERAMSRPSILWAWCQLLASKIGHGFVGCYQLPSKPTKVSVPTIWK